MHIYLPQELVQRIGSSFKLYEEGQMPLSPTKKRNTLEDIYFLCFYIIEKIVQKKGNNGLNQFANVSSGRMKYFVNKYTDVLNFLKNNFILKTTEPYSTGYNGKPSFSRAYRFFGRMDLSPVVKIELRNPYLLKKLKNKPGNFNGPQYLKNYKDEILTKVHLDFEGAEIFLLNLYREGPYEIMDFYKLYFQIAKFNMGNQFFKLEESGRLHHTFSSLSSKFRKFLRVEGEDTHDWVEVDISSCTPFLFSIYLIKKGLNKKDVFLFHDLARSHDFYSEVVEHMIYLTRREEGYYPEELDEYQNKSNRKRLKEIILKIFNRNPQSNRNSNDESELNLYHHLRGAFPSVFRELESLQRDYTNEGGEKIYDLLTPMESSVMIEFLVPQLVEQKIIGLTRHDGVLCLRKDAEKIKDIMKEGFIKKFGTYPTVKIK